MKFLAAENIAHQIVERLRQDGHDVVAVNEVAKGTPDPDVLALAVREQAILLTDDKDFGDLVIGRSQPTLGVVLVRLEGMPPSERGEVLAEVAQQHANELAHSFTVVARQSLRIRPP